MLNKEEIEKIVRAAVNESVKEIMTTVFSLDVSSTDIPGGGIDLICSIGFVGRLEGNIMLTFSQQNACRLVSKMLGSEMNELNQDVCDGSGEMLNMIAGGVKNRLAATEYPFDISIPTVIQGKELTLRAIDGMTSIRIGFECPEISFGLFAIFKVHEDVKTFQKMAVPKSSVNVQATLDNLIKNNKPGEGEVV